MPSRAMRQMTPLRSPNRIEILLSIQKQMMRHRELVTLYSLDKNRQLARCIELHNAMAHRMDKVDLTVSVNNYPRPWM